MVPELRFPEFDGEWEVKSFGDISSDCSYGMNSAAIEYDGIHKYIRITDIDESSNNYKPSPLCSPDGVIDDKYKLKVGDILFTRTGASTGKTYLYKSYDGNLYYAGFLIKFSFGESAKFVFYNTQLEYYRKWVLKTSMRSGQPGINSQEYKSYKLPLPTLPEQQKIADFLSAVDQRIQLLQKKKEHLETYKKGVMQQIFSQKFRFKDENGEDFPDWEEKKLGDVLIEHGQKNTQGEVNEVFSVSKEKGVLNQIEHLGRSYAAVSTLHYKIANHGDIIYTKSPTSDFPFGIIKQNLTKRTGIVSPLYGVFRPKTFALGVIIHNYFTSWVNTYNYLVPIVHRGAKNTMNINNSDFLKGKKLNLPNSVQEQQKIAEFLSSIDASIEQLTSQIESTQAFKKGLLQKMFV